MTKKAKESPEIQKARKKIKEQLKASNKLINQNALEAMSRLIKQQLLRQNPTRVYIKERQIFSFDENQHPAKVKNKFILKLIKKIETAEPQTANKLQGRIKTF